MTIPQCPWYPSRLLVANVRGRALITDSFLIGEYRRDPWKGFDLTEGTWWQTEGHQFEPAPVTVARTRRAITNVLHQFPLPDEAVKKVGEFRRFPEDEDPRTFIEFSNGVRVDQDILCQLVHLIDGEPAEYRHDGNLTHPVQLVDERGKWLGMFMPVWFSDGRPGVA